jgi:hypothetical protein
MPLLVTMVGLVVVFGLMAGVLAAGRAASRVRSRRMQASQIRQEANWLLHRQALAAFVAMLEAAREAERSTAGSGATPKGARSGPAGDPWRDLGS